MTTNDEENILHRAALSPRKMTKITMVAALAFVLVAVVTGILVKLLLFSNDENESSGHECVINPFEVNPHPLIVLSKGVDWIYPIHGENVLRFKQGTSLDFLCPGRQIIINNTQTEKDILTGQCISDTVFLIDDMHVEWRTLICGDFRRSIRDTGNSCVGNGKELITGFETDDGRFITALTICFNPQLEIAYYTFINQTSTINQRVLATPRPSFIQGSGIYTIGSATSYYVRAQQRATINTLVGLPENSTKYIQDSGNYFLSRGHMTARSDGFYAAQQNATFYMQNIAPQWHTVNGANWNQIEIDLRDYAEASASDLQVYCGVYGVTTLPHEETGDEIELYLFVNSTHKLLPVPEFYWKVAYNSLTKAAVALIGMNNPYKESFTPICEDISSNLSWFTCNSELVKGYCYACTVPSFRKIVTTLPDFPTKQLLT
ncbi:hypothetical protein ABEB36_003709 [Hypothenemus hampei]|uniref:DNA/RNA non-specific endonuclease domain-containing protein n=1 Tax=Hypothenemus hampei TaxID=57062 RepID=A0ABD1F0W4_HYPHA